MKIPKKLQQIGLSKIEQVPLYLPTHYLNFSSVVNSFLSSNLSEGMENVFMGALYGSPSTTFRKGQPHTKFTLTDGHNYLKFSLFGDTRKLVEELADKSQNNRPIYVFGTILFIGGYPYLSNAKIINDDEVGKVIPVYPGVPGKIKTENMAKLLSPLVTDGMTPALKVLREILHALLPDPRLIRKHLNVRRNITLEEILTEIHYPTSIEYATYCLEVMKKIATIVAASDVIHLAKQANMQSSVPQISGPNLNQMLERIPFTLTEEQLGITQRAIDAISKGNKLNLLILGDVGSGKSVVYFLIAAHIGYAGKKVAIMLPNGNLCRQIHAEFNAYFPDLNALLVSSDMTDEERIQKATIMIGTSALLFRELGELALSIVDESQKMSVEQQAKLLSPHTHSISVSATPIPRTMALATYGAVTIEKITKCHAVKQIYTRVLHKNQLNQLINEILWTIHEADKQAIVVCARKEDTPYCEEDAQQSDLISVEEALRIFEPLLPGHVVVSHSALSSEENSEALDAMRQGRAKLLIATTVVEVGVTLPDVSYLAILNAQQFGLSTLHQLRGRLARWGGEAWISLFLNRDITNPQTIKRLSILVDSNDGFHISEQDLQLRGVGDILNGSSQHGNYVGLIRNVRVEISQLESAIAELSDVN